MCVCVCVCVCVCYFFVYVTICVSLEVCEDGINLAFYKVLILHKSHDDMFADM